MTTGEPLKVRAVDAAQFLLYLSGNEPEPECMTNMRLQKLLYYAQGWSMALRGHPLFTDPIEAWKHGPVVRNVWREYTPLGNQPIPIDQHPKPTRLNEEDQDFLRSIWEHYKQYSATRLRTMTHAESPWRAARGECGPDDECQNEIEHGEMKRFFQSEHQRLNRQDGIPLERIRKSEEEHRNRQVKPLAFLTDRLRDAV